MIEVKARSGHVLRVADDEQAAYWVALGYERVEDVPAAKPARKRAARKAAPKSEK